MSVIDKAFSSDGLLAKAISGFTPRQAQLDMALEVEQAIANKSSLIVEAGTGTGKTFAYLIPALMSDKKVIISTGTKTLQEQLFHKDIPIIKKALATNAQMALLKGRSNYLCSYRLEQYQHSRGQLDAQMLADFVKVQSWSATTQSGDIGEIDAVAEDSAVPPEPVHERVNVKLPASGELYCSDPDVPLLPDQSPKASQVEALVDE